MTRPTTALQTGRPIVFGEVLFDIFPDHTSVLGGAPFNVAWHLQGFGASPLFISRVGQDALGQQVLERMQMWDMDTQGVQRDPGYPTGQVQISLQQGQPSYTILPDQAYDHIAYAELTPQLRHAAAPLLYYGTLITRQQGSHHTLQQLRRELATPCFIDLNLRAPWYQRERLLQDLADARWLKLNDEELAVLGNKTWDSPQQMLDEAQRLQARLHLELLILTCGAEGAYFIDNAQIEHLPTPKVAQLKDTVGAGDAFSAVTIFGLLQQWPLPVILKRAVEFAAAVCTLRGATTLDHHFYTQHLQHWQQD